MTALLCTRCSDEGHLIRVAPGRLAPLHLTRHDHPFGLVRIVRLARDGQDTRVPTDAVAPVHREGPEQLGRDDAPAASPSSRTPNRTRPAGNGRPRTASPSEVIR